jgi:hypothetical protein
VVYQNFHSNINSTEAFNNKKERFLAFISLFPIPTFCGIHIVRLTLNIDRPVVSGDDIETIISVAIDLAFHTKELYILFALNIERKFVIVENIIIYHY